MTDPSPQPHLPTKPSGPCPGIPTAPKDPENLESPENLEGMDPGWRFAGLEVYRPALERYLRGRVSDENDVQDLVQETFLRAARYRKPDQSSATLRGWLIRIASNLRVDAANRRHPWAAQCADLDALPERCDERVGGARDESRFAWAGRWWDLEEVLLHLRASWKRLSESDQSTLAGYYQREMSGLELAQDLGVRPELVKVRLFRARQRLACWVELRMRAVCQVEWGFA